MVGYSKANGLKGKACVIFGDSSYEQHHPAIELAELGFASGSKGFCISGLAASDRVGIAVGPAGDVNNDGRPDFIFGADGIDDGASNTGAAYVRAPS